MIHGYFDIRGRPRLEGLLEIPSLGVSGWITFLVDTGASATSVHPEDTAKLRIPLDQMPDTASFRGIGGIQTYHIAQATVTFQDGQRLRTYRVPVGILALTHRTSVCPPFSVRTSFATGR